MPFVYVISVLILVAIFAWLINFYSPVSDRFGRRTTPGPRTPAANVVSDAVNSPLNDPGYAGARAAEEARARGVEMPAEVRDGNLKKFANLVLLLVVIGIFLWLINTYVPMAASIKAILNIVVVLATCVMVLKVAGLWDGIVRMWDDLIHHRLAH